MQPATPFTLPDSFYKSPPPIKPEFSFIQNTESIEIYFNNRQHFNSVQVAKQLVTQFPYIYPVLKKGTHLNLEIKTIDCHAQENTLSFSFFFPSDTIQLTFNELLFNPKSEQQDFIELVHTGTKTYNLQEVFISNKRTVKGKALSKTDLFLYPHQYLVLCKDTSLLAKPKTKIMI